jgi:hypothetical protein
MILAATGSVRRRRLRMLSAVPRHLPVLSDPALCSRKQCPRQVPCVTRKMLESGRAEKQPGILSADCLSSRIDRSTDEYGYARVGSLMSLWDCRTQRDPRRNLRSQQP